MTTTPVTTTLVELGDSIVAAPPGFDPNDPYRYGWRYVTHALPGGHLRKERAPLTLEDVLHPEEDDFIVQTDTHSQLGDYLAIVSRAQVSQDPTAVVLHDVRILWGAPLHKAHGPDVAVIFGVRQRKRWSTFDVTEEGVIPALIMEITSPETAQVDLLAKVTEYEAVGVPLYIIIEIHYYRRGLHLRLLGYTLTPQGYEVLASDERGWLWLAPIRVWLGVSDEAIICYNEAGQPVGDYTVVTTALRAETAARLLTQEQAAAEAAARRQAEERAAAEAVARRQAEEQTAAEAVARRQAEERAVAEAIARRQAEERAESAEARLRTLEADLRRLRGE